MVNELPILIKVELIGAILLSINRDGKTGQSYANNRYKLYEQYIQKVIQIGGKD